MAAGRIIELNLYSVQPAAVLAVPWRWPALQGLGGGGVFLSSVFKVQKDHGSGREKLKGTFYGARSQLVLKSGKWGGYRGL